MSGLTLDEGIVEFRDTFLRRGWRGGEKNYGSCTNVIRKMIVRAGGQDLLAERALRNVSSNTGRTGRKAGGRIDSNAKAIDVTVPL